MTINDPTSHLDDGSVGYVKSITRVYVHKFNEKYVECIITIGRNVYTLSNKKTKTFNFFVDVDYKDKPTYH